MLSPSQSFCIPLARREESVSISKAPAPLLAMFCEAPGVERRSIMLELVDLVVEGFETDPQFARGGRFIAAVFLEDRLNVLHLDVSERRVAVGDLEMGRPDRRWAVRMRLVSRWELGWQVFGLNRTVARQDRGAFDDIGQLADISGPLVGHEQINRFH